jgi:general secretion pathway protein D
VLAVSGCRSGTLLESGESRALEGHAPLTTQTANPGAAAPGIADSRRNAGPASVFSGGTKLAPPMSGAGAVQGRQVTLDLQDADIAAAAKAVLGDIFRVSYSVDPRVQGRISIRTARPIPAQQAFALFEEALLQNGAALIDNNGVYAVIPTSEAANATTFSIRNAAGGNSGPGFGLRAVPLKHIAAKEMAEIIAPIAKDAVVRIDAERNTLVLQGTGAQFNSIMETIRTFDVDWLSKKSVGVFRINSMTADQMQKSLAQILQNESMDATMARFVVLDSNNTILVVAKTPQILASMRHWIQQLDHASSSALRLFTYEMRYARAGEAAQLVGGALGIQAVASGKDGTAQARPQSGQSARTNTPGQRQGMSGGTSPFQGMGSGAPGSQALDPARALLEQARRGDASGTTAGAGEFGTTARIVADETSNKLLVYSTSDQFERIKDVMRTIDIPQKQVLVEATIIEVSLNDDLRYGVQYYLDKVVNGTKIKGSLTPGSGGTLGPQTPGGSITVGLNTQAIVDALSGVTKVNIISSPNLMVMNNQSARLVVGDQVPITTQTRSDPLVNTNVQVSSVEFRDTGIIFDVTPRINAAGTVTLDILQEVSAVKQNSSQTLTPTISQRRVTSTVVVTNNETIVIGGLFSSDVQRRRSGLPVLSSIPAVGGLFGTTMNGEVKTELLVLISPKIVNGASDARRLTGELKNRISELRLIETRQLPAAPAPTSARAPRSAPPPPPECQGRAPCVRARY